MKFTLLVYPIDAKFCCQSISLVESAPTPTLMAATLGTNQPGTNTAAPQLRWRHWWCGMRHAVLTYQHSPGSRLPTRVLAMHTQAATRSLRPIVVMTSAAASRGNPTVMVLLTTPVLGIEAIEQHVYEHESTHFIFFGTMFPVTLDCQSNRRAI